MKKMTIKKDEEAGTGTETASNDAASSSPNATTNDRRSAASMSMDNLGTGAGLDATSNYTVPRSSLKNKSTEFDCHASFTATGDNKRVSINIVPMEMEAANNSTSSMVDSVCHPSHLLDENNNDARSDDENNAPVPDAAGTMGPEIVSRSNCDEEGGQVQVRKQVVALERPRPGMPTPRMAAMGSMRSMTSMRSLTSRAASVRSMSVRSMSVRSMSIRGDSLPLEREVSLGDLVQVVPENLPWWFPRFRGKPILYGSKEALGFVLGLVGRSIAFISATAFLATHFVNIVKEVAGCPVEPLPDEVPFEECDKTVYGIRPSSMLSMYTVFLGVVSSIMTPLVGAVSDYTPHRRSIARWLSFSMVILVLPTIFISRETWEIVAAAFVGMSLVGLAQAVVTYAYLPELTDDEDVLNYYTQIFTALPFVAVVCFLCGCMGVSMVFQWEDDKTLVIFAQISSFVIAAVLLGLAWGPLLQQRPAMHRLQQRKTLWTEGFVQIYNTATKIYKNYHALKWFYIAIAFSEAGVYTFMAVSISYQADRLYLNTMQNSIAILITLVSAVPGAFLGGWVTHKINPIWSSLVSVILLVVTVAAYSGILYRPDQIFECYLINFGWGLGTGWKWTCDIMLASIIIPDGQDAELMGFYNCAAQILAWLPPVLFTILNELYVSQRVAIGTINIFFVLAVLALLKMGSYKDARRVAKQGIRLHSSRRFSTENHYISNINNNNSSKAIQIEVPHDDNALTIHNNNTKDTANDDEEDDYYGSNKQIERKPSCSSKIETDDFCDNDVSVSEVTCEDVLVTTSAKSTS